MPFARGIRLPLWRHQVADTDALRAWHSAAALAAPGRRHWCPSRAWHSAAALAAQVAGTDALRAWHSAAALAATAPLV